MSTPSTPYTGEWDDHTVTGGPPLHDGWEGCLLLVLFVAAFVLAFTLCSPHHHSPHSPPCQTK